MDIQTISIVIAAISVVIGVINSIMSNRMAAQQREADLFMSIYDRLHKQELAKAIWQLRFAPDYESYDTFEDYWQHQGPRANLEEYSESSAVFAYFNGIGLLVKRGMIDIELVEDLMKGRVMRTWEKVEPFIRARVETKVKNLRRLRRRINIWDADAVKRYIAGSSWGNNYKLLMEYTYFDFCKFNGFDYKLTKYPRDTKIPYVPLEKDIDELNIGFKGSKYMPMLQLLKESGFRPEEAFRLTPDDFDLEQKTVTLNKPAKRSLPRQFKMSDRLLSMIIPLVKKTPMKERL